MISNLKKLRYPWFIQKYFSIVRVMMSHVFLQKFCSEKQCHFICLSEIHSQASHTFKTKSNFIINSLSYIIPQYVCHCVRWVIRVYVSVYIRHPYPYGIRTIRNIYFWCYISCTTSMYNSDSTNIRTPYIRIRSRENNIRIRFTTKALRFDYVSFTYTVR